ncbi:MAG TPA: type VI secretion system-associated protein TagF [Polyangia bacterium]|nr:type VI secretion system-associated protein TagF [Polyangia bacterium]
MATTQEVSSPIGVYGKLGSQPDFFRFNAGEFSQAALDRFFQDAMEALRGEGTKIPEAPTAFVMAPGGGPVSFLGCFARSEDSAGRAFPLVVFARAATSDLLADLPAVLDAHEAFLQSAGGLSTAGVNGLDGAAVLEQLRGLNVGAVRAPSDAAWESETIQPLLAAFNGSAPDLAYALKTMGAACDQALKAGVPGRATPITIDAPAPTARLRAWWIELVCRRLRWRDAYPALMWTQTGRLLMTLGNPIPAGICYVCNSRHRATRFWPLRTSVSTAADSAINGLTPEQRQCVERPETSLADLMAAFS